MRLTGAIVLTLFVFTGEAAEVVSPREIIEMTRDEAATSGVRRVRGVVTFVSGLSTNRFVIAPEMQRRQTGLEVERAFTDEMPEEGDLVLLTGRLAWWDGAPLLKATGITVVRNERLPQQGAKQYDFRRGQLAWRRVSLFGTVREARLFPTNDIPMTELRLHMDTFAAVVRVAGLLDAESYLGRPVRITGLARNVTDDENRVLDAWLEVSEPEDIEILPEDESRRPWMIGGSALGGVLLVLALVFLVLWMRARRERREMSVIAAERRRMAADLHDTIEQHLAGANLLVAGMMDEENVPGNVLEMMQALRGLLANAKSEVRSAVLNLRSTGEEGKALSARIREMAHALRKTGIKARCLLRGLPAAISEGMYEDIVLILNEATTNAVKHGHAKTILFTADPKGASGFTLRVLNDGEPFTVDRALGPETGHYGLSGMKERALRNHLAILWGRVRIWTYMQLSTEGS